MIIGSSVGTYFSHGLGVYSCICGMYPSAWWSLMYYTNGQEVIALHGTYVDPSTWYSSYMILGVPSAVEVPSLVHRPFCLSKA